MRLCEFTITNFKGIESGSITWDNIIVLIGENNAGKSTVLQALDLFLSGTQIKDASLFHQNRTDEANAIELVGVFDGLTEEEKDAVAVRGRTFENRWHIKKKYWCEVDDDGNAAWKEQYYSYSATENFIGWPDPDKSWSSFGDDYEPLIQALVSKPAKPNAAAREELRELVREQRPDLIGENDPAWVPNPGGGGNWKSNANSKMPRFVFIRAVRDASDEAVSKDASAYGKIVGILVESKLMRRPEFIGLRASMDEVLNLFSPDDKGQIRSEEIRELQSKINSRLNEVTPTEIIIRTEPPNLQPILLPCTNLLMRDTADSVETPISHQGHGVQRTLIFTLLQILEEYRTEAASEPGSEIHSSPVILAIEEPELYMHPQMERKMRDLLYNLSSRPSIQVICTTHSPVFIDVGQNHKAIVRVTKDGDLNVKFTQVMEDLFSAEGGTEKELLSMVAKFHPGINEVFFAKAVVLLEEESAIAAFTTGAEVTGLFQQHPHCRYDVSLVDCCGKTVILLYQDVLNHFAIPYRVVHDEDHGREHQINNANIASKLEGNQRRMISPDLEGMLGYSASSKQKPYKAMLKVKELGRDGLPEEFVKMMNWIYFGEEDAPGAADIT